MDCLAKRELKVLLESLDLLVYQVQQGLLVVEEGEVSEVQPDLLDLWENQVHLVEEACLEMMVLQVPKVNLETEDLLDHLAPKASKEI